MSLKKLPSVSFAGVDSLDDVKNHTYNELFVSGGFIVSDEFVLNPDLITQGKVNLVFLYLWKYNTQTVRLVLSRTFAGAAEIPGGAEHA